MGYACTLRCFLAGETKLMEQPEYRDTFGYRLKSLRMQCNLTQQELAEKSGYSTVAISYLERNQRKPAKMSLENLSKALNLTDEERAWFIGDILSGPPDSAVAHFPVPLTPLLGREREIQRGRNWIAQQGVRLLTISGPAGVGKTRLATQLAMDLRGEFGGEIYFMDLAALLEPDLVFTAIASTLGLHESGKQSLREQVIRRVGERRMLWVLDNFEQILAAREAIVALLKECPNLVIIVTSRRALRVRGEQIFPVRPLAVPGSQQNAAERRAGGLLRRADVRLVTLYGPGMISSLRLAFQLENQTRRTFQCGVYSLDCARLTDRQFLPALARCLGLTEEIAGVTEIIAHLQAEPTLLVFTSLDNLTLAPAIIDDLLSQCATLTILATARVPLRLPGERVVLAPRLAAEGEEQSQSLESALQSPAIALFCQRARAIQPEFTLTRTNAPAVIEICRLMEGLPLALELAAARLTVFSPVQLLEKLAAFDTLAAMDTLLGGAADLPERQRSLFTAFAWSYDLLDPESQRVLQHMSLFAGGCTASDLADLYRERGVAPHSLDSTITILVDSSLVQVSEIDDGATLRFWLLLTIREYGNMVLDRTGEAPAWRQAFATLYYNRVEQLAPQLLDQRQPLALQQVGQQLENLRETLRWAARTDGAVTVGLQVAISLRRYWDAAGLLSEGRAWLHLLLQGLQQLDLKVDPLLEARALYVAGFLADLQWDFPAAKSLFQASIRIGEEHNDPATIARAEARLGVIAVDENRFEEGIGLLEHSLAIWEALHINGEIATIYQHLGYAAKRRNDILMARTYYEKSLPLQELEGDLLATGNVLNELGTIEANEGNFDSALTYYQRCYALFQQLHSDRKLATVLNNLGRMANFIHDYAMAVQFYEESLVLRQKTEDEAGIALAMLNIAEVNLLRQEWEQAHEYIMQGNTIAQRLQLILRLAEADKYLAVIAKERQQFQTAKAHYLHCLGLLHSTPSLVYKIDCFNGLAEIAHAQGDDHAAVVIYAQATKMQQSNAIQNHQLYRADLHYLQQMTIYQQLGKATYDLAWQEGWQWDVEPFGELLCQQGESS